MKQCSYALVAEPIGSDSSESARRLCAHVAERQALGWVTAGGVAVGGGALLQAMTLAAPEARPENL